MINPLCFVLMPFGKKYDSQNREIDFDEVYKQLIKPAIIAANMEPIRADEEMVGGIIHKPMFERLLMCDYAIADLTTANANVFYELGVRHAARPFSTLPIFAKDTNLPFDVGLLRGYPYSLNTERQLDNIEEDMKALTNLLNAAREQITDSPLYQFFDELEPHAIAHEKTDIFRDRVRYSSHAKRELESLRRGQDLKGMKTFEEALNLVDTEGGILIDLFLSYRALEAWDEMIDLSAKLPDHLANSLMIREQLGFALNRAGRGEEAEEVLSEAVNVYGVNSETLGILGRVYKDRWKAETDPILKESLLKKAIDTYIEGFEADWRDAYPGINAITLMNSLDVPDARFDDLMHAVSYAVKRKIAQSKPDYWDLATLMELTVLAKNEQDARELLLQVLAKAEEAFMPKTTADTLIMLRDKWRKSGENIAWIEPFIESLMSKYELLGGKYDSK